MGRMTKRMGKTKGRMTTMRTGKVKGSLMEKRMRMGLPTGRTSRT